MNKLPLETLQQIFELACTDGGYTGCCVALTSKSIRVAAQSTRFHSVALAADAERLVALITLYQKECSTAGVRPRMAHLHLSFIRPVDTNMPLKPDYEEEADEEDEDEEEADPTFIVATRQLFTLIVGDLQSLVLSGDTANVVHPLFDCAFPSLTELTFLRHGDLGDLIAPDFKSGSLPLFPALTHLHVVKPSWPQPLLSHWVKHAPRVTHLRVSAHCLFGNFVDELPDAVGTPAYPFNRQAIVAPPPARRTYPSLVRVVVQPGPRPLSGPCGTNRMVFNSKTTQLAWIADRAKGAGVEFHVLSPCEWKEVVFREWGKRIAGEPGRDWFSAVDGDEDENEEAGNEG